MREPKTSAGAPARSQHRLGAAINNGINTRIALGLCSAVVVTIAGCGGAERGRVAEMYAEVAAQDGFDVDEQCVQRVLGAMSDDDVRALDEAGLAGSAELSQKGLTVLNDVAIQCVDRDQYIATLIADLAADPETTADLGCVEAELKQLTSIAEIDAQTPDLLIDCTPPG